MTINFSNDPIILYIFNSGITTLVPKLATLAMLMVKSGSSL